MSVALGYKYSPDKKLVSAGKIMEGNYKPSDVKNIFQCTKCRACEQICPEHIEITKLIDMARGKYVAEKGVKFGAQRELIKNVCQYGSPFGRSASRVAFPKAPRTSECRTLFFAGCFSSYVNKDIALAGFNILKKLGIDFIYLGDDEPCCGYFIYNTGDHKTSGELLEKNKKLFKEKNIERIITVCPGCSTFFTKYYHMDTSVVHISKVISDVIKEKEIPLKKYNGMVTFHDACNIGRSLGLYQEPRDMIHALGYTLVEMALSKESAICCGADGGMKIVFPGLAIEIGKTRLDGMPKNCDRLFTICPFCLSNFKEASDKYKKGVEVLNLLMEFNNALL
jgi:heterodisulfide reductase subunit D